MSHRRSKPTREPEPAPIPVRRAPDTGAFALVCCALVIAATGYGMLADRVASSPQMASPYNLSVIPIVCILVAVAGVLAILRGRLTVPRNPTGFAIGAFAALATCSAAISHHLCLSVAALAVCAAAITVGALMARCARPEGRLETAAIVVAIGGLIAAAFGLNEYLATWWGGVANWRVFGRFVDPNFLAGFLLMTLPVTAAVFLAMQRSSFVALAGVAMALQAACSLLTQSRLGLLGLVVGCATFAVLAWRSGALSGANRKRAIGLVACVAVVAVAAIGPVAHRIASAHGEAYSLQFRIHTWRGTQRLAMAHPVLGAGIGTFEATYPPFADVGYTQHAHNSIVQLAAEVGYPGLLALLVAFAAVLASGTVGSHMIRSTEAGARAPALLPSSSPLDGMDRRILCAGIVGALAGAIVHNLFDSDLYIPVNALYFAALCGMALAGGPPQLAAELPSGDSRARAFRWLALGVMAILAANGCQQLASRNAAFEASSAVEQRDAATAIDRYRQAVSLDPWNADLHMSLASVLEATGQTADAEREYAAAVRLSPTVRALRRYGRFLMRQGRVDDAIIRFEKARQADPLDPQNLLALAEAYRSANRPTDATAVYQEMVRQYRGPVGTIRAVPELVPWEYGMALLALAENRIATGDRAGAEPLLQEGDKLLSMFCASIKDPMAQARQLPTDVVGDVTTRLEWGLDQWAQALDTLHRPEDAAKARQQLEALRAAQKP